MAKGLTGPSRQLCGMAMAWRGCWGARPGQAQAGRADQRTRAGVAGVAAALGQAGPSCAGLGVAGVPDRHRTPATPGYAPIDPRTENIAPLPRTHPPRGPQCGALSRPSPSPSPSWRALFLARAVLRPRPARILYLFTSLSVPPSLHPPPFPPRTGGGGRGRGRDDQVTTSQPRGHQPPLMP